LAARGARRSTPGTFAPSLCAFVLSALARLQPQVGEKGESLVRPPQQRLDPLLVQHIRAVDLRSEHETFGVHQDVTLAPLYLLASVLTPVFSAYRGALDRLGIDHARAGLRIPFQANPKALADGAVDVRPATVDAPFPEVPLNGGPPGKVVGQQPPLASALKDVEDGAFRISRRS
jgi:hypothetical protein